MKPKDLLALTFLGALWGGSFLFIRIAAPGFGPLVLMELRVGVPGYDPRPLRCRRSPARITKRVPSGWQAVFHRTAIPMSCKSYPSSLATSMVRNDG